MYYVVVTDTHYGHDMLITKEYRPHNFADLIDASVARIPNGSVLIHLGDVCFGNEIANHEFYIQKHKHIKKILVRGNHDKRSNTWYIEHGWDFVCSGFTLDAYGKKILFTHKPVPRTDQAHLNIHGHFHASDHRTHEPEFQAILDPDFHVLLAMEHPDINYQVQKLDTFLAKKKKI